MKGYFLALFIGGEKHPCSLELTGPKNSSFGEQEASHCAVTAEKP